MTKPCWLSGRSPCKSHPGSGRPKSPVEVGICSSFLVAIVEPAPRIGAAAPKASKAPPAVIEMTAMPTTFGRTQSNALMATRDWRYRESATTGGRASNFPFMDAIRPRR
jgi:hypothetical protein